MSEIFFQELLHINYTLWSILLKQFLKGIFFKLICASQYCGKMLHTLEFAMHSCTYRLHLKTKFMIRDDTMSFVIVTYDVMQEHSYQSDVLVTFAYGM